MMMMACSDHLLVLVVASLCAPGPWLRHHHCAPRREANAIWLNPNPRIRGLFKLETNLTLSNIKAGSRYSWKHAQSEMAERPDTANISVLFIAVLSAQCF